MYMQWETCFENEAKGNSKMAFYVSLNISYSLSNPFGSIGQLFFMNFCLNMATDPGGTAIHVLYICRCEGYDFQAVYSSIGCINQSVWVQNRVSFFTKLTSWLKILSRILSAVRNRDSDGNPCPNLGLTQDCSVPSTLVQGSKIQLKQLWYRLRVHNNVRDG